MLRRLYHKLHEAADSPQAFGMFCIISFAESSFFPLPPDILMIPMVLAERRLAWRLAFWGTVTSVAGGMLGYAIGYFLFETVGQWIINTYGLSDGFGKFQDAYAAYGFWLIALKGLTPIPFKLVTIASGLAGYPLHLFVIASIIARAFRFYALAAVLWYFGPRAKSMLDRHLEMFVMLFMATIISGFFIVKYFF